MDIIILGSGAIGLTMANLLVQQTSHNYKITLISPTNIIQDVRYSAINRVSQNIFKYLQVWNEIIDTKPGMYDQIYLLDKYTKSHINLYATDLGITELGYIINNNIIINVLFRHMKNVTLIKGMLYNIKQNKNKLIVQINNQKLVCDLIIGADGGKSYLRKYLNIHSYQWNYNHHAIVTTVKLFSSHKNTATQIFYPNGPLAFLPLSNNLLCSIVWSTKPEYAKMLMQMSDKEFAAEIDVAEICLPRRKFPLYMLHAKKYFSEKAVLIGDSAHVIHPLAGQGMNLGLLDAATLAECLENALNNRVSIQDALIEYESIRRGYNWGMIGIIEGFKKIFEINNPIITWFRNIGMQGIDRLQICKNLLAKAGIGVIKLDDLPNIVRSSLYK